LSAGTYTVTITDNKGCIAANTVTITEPNLLVVNITATDSVDCNGGSDGGANITVSGGTSPYTYTWVNVASDTVSTAMNPEGVLAAGNYTVTVKDSLGCIASADTTILEPNGLMLTMSSDSVLCTGGSTGSASVAVTGGTGLYTYLWSNGATGSIINNVAAGEYIVTVTDANGCTKKDTIDVFEPALLEITSYAVRNVNCFGGSDGTVAVKTTGGTGTKTFEIKTGSSGYVGTTDSTTNMYAGVYMIRVTDANGCMDSVLVTVIEPALLIATIASSTNVSCKDGENGTSSVTIAGGNTPYSVSWSNGDTGMMADSLSAGTYTVTITDNKGCIATNTVTITEPNLLVVNITATDSVDCNGGSDGGANITVSGGTSPYTYTWVNVASDTVSTAMNPEGVLAAGNYTVTVKDSLGCIASADTTILEPNGLMLTMSSDSVLCTGGSTGSASVAVTGGTGLYTYLWSNGATGSIINNVAAGEYIVTVTDANGCTKKDTIDVFEPALLEITSYAVRNVNCFGGSDGTVAVKTTGGTGTKTFEIKTGSSGYVGTTDSTTNMYAGVYMIRVTDANGCMDSVLVTVIEPALLIATIASSTNVSCKDGENGTSSVTIAGGNTPYSVSWSNGDTGMMADSLSAGTYTVTITDNKGCIATNTVTITEPNLLVVNITATDSVDCNGGSDGGANIIVSGGTSPNTYTWVNAASDTISTAKNPVGVLAAGNYTVTVKDSLGCVASADTTILEPNVLDLTLTAVNAVGCVGSQNGAIDLAITGGTGAKTISWTGPSGYTASADSIFNLFSGKYVVTVTDAKGCVTKDSITLVDLGVIEFDTTLNQITCNGLANGSIKIDASNPANSGDLFKFRLRNITTSTVGAWTSVPAISHTFSGLAPGSYSFDIQNSLGCIISDNDPSEEIEFTITQPAVLTASISSSVPSGVICNGEIMTLTANYTGGTMPVQYSWNAGPASGTNTFVPLTSGTYTVNVIDVNNCSATASFNVLIKATSANTIDSTSCSAVTINGTEYITSGVFEQTLTNSVGCDSVLTINFTRLMGTVATLDTASCSPVVINGTTISVSGTTVQTLVNAAGCDSTLTINFTRLMGTVATLDTASCSPVVINGTTISVSGTTLQTLTNTAGCDSVLTINFTKLNGTIASMDTVSCSTVTINDSVYASSGTYVQTLTNAAGCDSVLTINFTKLNGTMASKDTVSCSAVTINDSVYATSGTYVQTLTNAAGCDSVLTINFTKLNGTMASIDTVSCSAITINDSVYATSGTYVQTLTNAAGCDSVLTINFTLNPAGSSDTTVVACNSFTWKDSTYTASGLYIKTGMTAAGCTQTDSLNLTITNLVANIVASNDTITCRNDTLTLTASGGTQFLWSTGDTTATISVTVGGVYKVTVSDSLGCSAIDSVEIFEDKTLPNITITGDFSLNCTTNQATLVANGGLSYEWRNIIPGSIISTNDTLVVSMGGQYYLTGVGSNGCISSTSRFIMTGTPTPPGITNLTGTNVLTCLVDTISVRISGPAFFNTLVGPNGTVSPYIAPGTFTPMPPFTYHLTVPGVYTATAPPMGPGMCGGIATITIGIDTAKIIGDTLAIEECASYTWNDSTYISSGFYSHIFAGTNGCDSTVYLNLTINPNLTGLNIWNYESFGGPAEVCKGLNNGFLRVNPWISGGEGTVDTLVRWLHNNSTSRLQENLEPGNYYIEVTGIDSRGCMVKDTMGFGVNPVIVRDTVVIDTVACGSIVINDSTYFSSTVITIVTPGLSFWVCDSTTIINLTINPLISSDTTVVACNSFTWKDSTYTASGVFVKTGLTSLGCVKSDTLHLTINLNVGSDTTVVACNSFTWKDSTYTSSGVHVKTGLTTLGCTQSDTLRLTINPSVSSDTTVVACNSFTWMDSTYTTSGVYVKTGMTAAGCMKSDTLNLTIESYYLAKLQVSTNVISCKNSVIPIIALNESNDVTLQWSVSNFGTFLQIGNTLNAGTPGKYTYKPFNFSGNCILSDTIIIVIDTSKVYGDTLAVSACNSYTWNDSTYSVSGLYSKSFPRAINGCDSLTYLNLTINPSISSDTTVVACNSFTWNDSTYTSSGIYVKTGSTALGCTQSDTLRLSINKSVSSDTTVVACNSFTWKDSTYTTSGLYIKTGITANGCTQTDSLNLTINPSISSDTTVVACNGFTWKDSTYTSSGVYVKISTTTLGCVQSDTLHLTIEEIDLLVTNPSSAVSVDITASSVTTGSTLPSGTVLTYHTDAEGTLTLGSPEAITIAGTYYIKATSANGCVDIKPVVVTITNNCPDNLVLVSPTDDQSGTGVVKKAEMTIIATNKVNSGANVGYQAGKSITLNPGTEISAGSVFKAEIKGCDN
jgi:hypothetical protein